MLELHATLVDGECRLRAVNVGSETIHVFDCDDMPYLLPDGDGGGVLVLHGMHEPPEEYNYYGIEIPTTRPLEPGEDLVGSVQIEPLLLHSHYVSGDPIAGLSDEVRVRTAVGWGTTPLDDATLFRMSLSEVCGDWQHLAEGPTLTIAQ